MRHAPVLLLLGGCFSGVLGIDDAPPAPPPPLALSLTAPADRAFAGEGPFVVEGTVNDPAAVVRIEGREANVGSDGRFRVELPFEAHARVVTVEALRGDERVVQHRTVLRGEDPLATWPGALALRLTPTGLDHLAQVLAAQLDAMDLPGQLAAAIPTISASGFTFSTTGASALPAEAALTASDDGLVAVVTLREAEILFDVDVPLVGAIPGALGLDEITFGAALTFARDDAGALVIAVSDTDVVLGTPNLEVAGWSSSVLESVAAVLTAALAAALEGAVDLGALAFGSFALPSEPIATDALGMPLSLELTGADTDPEGVALLLGVDLGVPAPGAPHVPTLAESGAEADLAVALHEGLLQGLLAGDLLAMLDLGTLELPGVVGEIVALPLAALPGGAELPADRTGMCLGLALGDAGFGRLTPALDPLAVIVLPDLQLDVGVSTPTLHCSPWVSASLAVEARLAADGAVLRAALDVVDGAVLSYAPTAEWTEDEVIDGLGGLVDAASSLLGASLEIDLGALVDPAALGLPVEVAPELVSVAPATGADGVAVPGTVVLGVRLWK